MASRIIVTAALVFAACNSSYIYRPQTQATATVRGHVAADYPLPSPAEPQGDARIASFGVSKIKRNDGTVMHALHVRMDVSDSSAKPFVFDVREQHVQLRDKRTLAPQLAQSDGNDVPTVTVPPGGKRTVDLFFALPPDEEKASKVPQFDFLWRIDAGGQIIAQRTPFERLAIEPAYAYGGYGWGPAYWGPYGWYDPMWGPGFIGAPNWWW